MFNKNISIVLNKKDFYCLFTKIIFILFLMAIMLFIHKKQYNKNIIEKLNKSEKINISYEKCYLPLDSSKVKIIHLIMTRFLMEFYTKEFNKKIYQKDYILNGFRVLKQYLFPSLENQSCKDFIWILVLGNKANITYVKSVLNLNNNSFQSEVIYEKEIKNYVKKISSGFDVLITTRIDYDDRIYYDSVNDVRKAVNINRPMILYGYNRGFYYFEFERKYYELYKNY